SAYGTIPRRRTSSVSASADSPGGKPSAVVGVKALQLFLHVGHELVRDRAVDETMVVAQREVRHRADADGIVDGDRALLDGPDTEDGHLRLVDDRHAELRPELPRVRDREGPAVYFVGVQ